MVIRGFQQIGFTRERFWNTRHKSHRKVLNSSSGSDLEAKFRAVGDKLAIKLLKHKINYHLSHEVCRNSRKNKSHIKDWIEELLSLIQFEAEQKEYEMWHLLVFEVPPLTARVIVSTDKSVQVCRKHTSLAFAVLTQIAVGGTALAGGRRIGVMRVIPVLLWLPEVGAGIAGCSWDGKLVGMAFVPIPKPQSQIHSGRQGDGTGQLPIPGIAGTHLYLAAEKRESRVGWENENDWLHTAM